MVEKALQNLKKYFGYDNFRSGQAKIIESVLSRQDTLGIMPTGGGKSICYQIPALCFDGLSIVISPLISLMKDQIDTLRRIGYPAGMLNSSVDYGEQQIVMRQAEVGSIKLLYVTPERCATQKFINWLESLDISLFCIDEAHCISEWGHDFRVEYRKLADVIEQIGRPPVLALTATATKEVQTDIVKSLRMGKPNIFISGFNRDNLIYGIQIHRTQEEKNIALIEFLKVAKAPGIIYVSAVKTGELLLNILHSQMPNRRIAIYHGGLAPAVRKQAQDDFLHDKIEILIATNAFGMGVDKSNIRFVVHYNIPGTIESYYQETGRAGRDGKMSWCLLLYLPQDERIQQFFIEAKNPSVDDMTYMLNQLTKLARRGSVYVEDLPDLIDDKKIGAFKIDGIIKQLEFLGFIELQSINVDTVDIEIVKPLKNEALSNLYNEISSLAEFGRLNITLKKLGSRLGSSCKEVLHGLDILKRDKTIKFVLTQAGHTIRVVKEHFTKADIAKYTEHTKEKIAFDKEKFGQVVKYSLIENECRRKFLLGYFGEEYSETNCGKCDVCRKTHKNVAKPLEMTNLHQSILTFFMNHNNKIGRRNAVKILKGSYDLDPKYRDWDEYASLKSYKDDQLDMAINNLCYQSLLTVSTGKYPVVMLSDKGLSELKKSYIKLVKKKQTNGDKKF